MTNLTCVNANEVGIVINNCRWWGPYWIRSPTEEGKMKKILEFRQSRVGERSSNDTSPNITVVHHNLRWSFFLLMIIILLPSYATTITATCTTFTTLTTTIVQLYYTYNTCYYTTTYTTTTTPEYKKRQLLLANQQCLQSIVVS